MLTGKFHLIAVYFRPGEEPPFAHELISLRKLARIDFSHHTSTSAPAFPPRHRRTQLRLVIKTRANDSQLGKLGLAIWVATVNLALYEDHLGSYCVGSCEWRQLSGSRVFSARQEPLAIVAALPFA